jgi:hypothetical protein
MQRWCRWIRPGRWGALLVAGCVTLAAAGCGQLFQVAGTSTPTLSDLAQQVQQLQSSVSELQATVASMGPTTGGSSSTSGGASSSSGAQASGSDSSSTAAGIGAGSTAAQSGYQESAQGAASGSGSGPMAVVTADVLNVRMSPDVSSAKVGVVLHGTDVEVLGTQGAWTEIGFKTLKGWVETRYLGKTG